MRIAVASDVHGLWYDLEYPEADVLIFAGDILDFYSIDPRQNAKDQLSEISQFNLFLDHYGNKYSKIIIIGGNHDFAFQLFPKKSKELLSSAALLTDESLVFNDTKFYGSPWQPWFGGWAFNFKNPRKDFTKAKKQAQLCWKAIPKTTEVLITHTPPLNVLDKTARGQHVGCQYLSNRLEELSNLSLHVFGHIHASRGSLKKKGLLSINASNSYRHDSVDYPMHLVDLENGVATLVE